jgi:hypothetical protein
MGQETPALVEELFGVVAFHPRFEDRKVRWIRPHLGNGHLVRAESSFDRDAIDRLRARPSLRRAKNNGRPTRALGHVPLRACVTLDLADRVEAPFERCCERFVNKHRIVARDEPRIVAVSGKQVSDVFLRGATEDGGPRDLVPVEMKHREHGTIAHRIQKTHALPRSLERRRLRLAVPDNGDDDKLRVVERRAKRVREDVTPRRPP